MVFGRSGGCPGGAHGPYKPIPSNFGGIWSYMAWGESIFMFFGNIGNSLHHQIPPNWSSGLQIGPRIFLGVAHTIFVGSGAHDICWELRTRYFLGVAHTILFGSGAHDMFWVWRTRYLLGVAHTIFSFWMFHGFSVDRFSMDFPC